MFVFGLAVDKRGGEAAARRVNRMMAARGGDPDGVSFATAPHASAGLARWCATPRDGRAVSVWDEERKWLTTGDVRLYNRRELVAALRFELDEADPSDLDLARLAYARWGVAACSRLIGDYAFAVWDEASRTLFAARDHLGVRPLYRHETREGVILASDVRQILCLLPSVLSRVDDHKILDRFTSGQRTHGRTFFRGISLVRPGHYLLARETSAQEVRYWFPPEIDERASYEEHCEALRFAFQQAVRDRLDTDRPIVAHSSGGYDSSSIVIAAEHVYAEGGARAPLVMASALTPGMPSDESHLMDLVAQRVRFEGHRWNALEPNTADIDDPLVVRPGQRRGLGGGPRGDIALAQARGARVLLTGGLGDTVMFAWGLHRDFFANRQWGPLARETVGRSGPRSGGRRLLKAGLGALSPGLALWLGQRVFGRPGPPPRWFGPQLRAIYPPGPEELDTLERAWPSHLTCELWARVTSPQVSAGIEAHVQSRANDALEVRMPYADVRFIESVLRIPARLRLGRRRAWALRHDVLGGMMPDQFRTRTRQPSWEPTFARAARHLLPRILDFLTDGNWLSGAYCERPELERWLTEVVRKGEGAAHRDLIVIAGLGVLEAWLRCLLLYDTRREVVE